MPLRPLNPSVALAALASARSLLQPSTWLNRLSTLLPTSCGLCGAAGEDTLCPGCKADHLGNEVHRCRQCGIALTQTSHDRCGACISRPPAFDATIAAVDYAPPLDHLVMALKFGGRLELTGLLARVLHETVVRSGVTQHPELLTAVPLGSQRLSERGFNQALEIAKPLSRALGIPLLPRLLLRQRDTLPQSLLHPNERHKNIGGAFLLSPAFLDHVRGKHVGVVDDVMTTGETLQEVAKVLKRFGAARVTNLVFARTLP